MVADSDLQYFRGYSRQRGQGFGALAGGQLFHS